MRGQRSSIITYGLILLIYSGIILLIYLGEKSEQFLLQLGILLIIAALQNHLQILQHEGAHYLLHPNRKINDLVCDIFCTLPFFGWVRHYRYFHFLHHRHLLNPLLDPEVEFYKEQGYEFNPLNRIEKFKIFIKDLSGYNFLRFNFSYNFYIWEEKRDNFRLKLTKLELGRGVFVLAIMTMMPWKLLAFYWILPQATILFVLMKMHGLTEHSKRRDSIASCTFNHEVNIIQKFFISPLNSHLHLEHHLRPQIPWFQLSGHDNLETSRGGRVFKA